MCTIWCSPAYCTALQSAQAPPHADDHTDNVAVLLSLCRVTTAAMLLVVVETDCT